MKITVAHSPDSDDAFMFYGLASKNVVTDGFEVEQVLDDIETLNRSGVRGTIRSNGGIVSRLRAFSGSLCPASTRREYG